jgi:hypothetical protein
MRLPLRLTPPPLIAVAGIMNAGKSHLINRLIGNYLPSEPISCTHGWVEVTWGVEVERHHLKEGRRKRIDSSQFDKAVRHDPDSHVSLKLPQIELLNLRILDTPGFSDPDREMVNHNFRQLGCHGFVWCVNFGNGICDTDLRFLDRLISSGLKLLGVIITKSDMSNNPTEEHSVKCDETVDRLRKGGLTSKVLMSARSEPEVHELWRWLDEGARQIPTGLDKILQLKNSI